jgi:hypothetical protein
MTKDWMSEHQHHFYEKQGSHEALAPAALMRPLEANPIVADAANEAAWESEHAAHFYEKASSPQRPQRQIEVQNPLGSLPDYQSNDWVTEHTHHYTEKEGVFMQPAPPQITLRNPIRPDVAGLTKDWISEHAAHYDEKALSPDRLRRVTFDEPTKDLLGATNDHPSNTWTTEHAHHFTEKEGI